MLLVGVLKHPEDKYMLLNKRIYRIPTQYLPVRDFDKIAFYEPASWSGNIGRIEYYGAIESADEVNREAIDIEDDVLEHERYMLYHFPHINKLDKPVVNESGTRISFHYTTEEQLLSSSTILELFDIPDIEMKVMKMLDDMSVLYEREYYVPVENANYYRLDFAIVTQKRKIDIECDGKSTHSSPTQIKKDSARDEVLRDKGWSILRLKEDEIIQQPDKCRERIANLLK